MTPRIPGRCPVCQNPLRAVRLRCPRCGTSIEGEFGLPRLLRLSLEQQHFVEVFVSCRGNIREVERVLGLSYPAVRARLDGVIAALGYAGRGGRPAEAPGLASPGERQERREVLAALRRGELGVEEALRRLRERGEASPATAGEEEGEREGEGAGDGRA